MQSIKYFIGLIFFSAFLLGQSAIAENFAVSKADGTPLSVVANFPSGAGPYPALVLASGQGYHMTLPAMEAVATALSEQGIAVFRFNWAYFTAQPKGAPSDDFTKEIEDFQAVLAAVRKHPKVLSKNISVGGKSLGSMVSWKLFTADSQLRSLLLLTPVCSRVPKGETQPRTEAKENYPGFEKETRPILLVSGDKDSLCAPSVLYGFAATRGLNARVAVVGGDHSYENRALSPALADVALKRNLLAVSALAVGFVVEFSSEKP